MAKRFNFEFEEARILVRAEQLHSRTLFYKWHALNKPARIPKRPDRAYKKEWVSWNDFLGNNNPFPCYTRDFRPYVEARSFAQQLNFKKKAEWLEYAKSGNRPESIPSRPDVYYQKTGEWFTWKEFLGYDSIEKIKSISESAYVLFIIQYPDSPFNVYKVGATNGGMSAIYDNQKKIPFKIIQVFDMPSDFDWKEIVDRMCRPYTANNIMGEYIVPNYYELVNAFWETGEISELR